MIKRKITTLIVAGAALSQATYAASNDYTVDIKRTSYGIPHITANDYGSLGYGEGYVAGEDHVCNISYAVTEARGELSKYFGPGEDNNNLISDVVYRSMPVNQKLDLFYEKQAPELQAWIDGYTAGFNRYIADTGIDSITSWCKGAEWVTPITRTDLMRRAATAIITLPYIGGMIAGAQPPAEVTSDAGINVTPNAYAAAIDGIKLKGNGSNAWALGKDLTENGRGMLMGNPHYPWHGSNQFWEKHLTIPGELDVYGSHLVGIPGVSIGFNENVGWSHTVSSSKRILLYKLDLVPGDPTSYFYDGEPRKMTSQTLSIPMMAGPGKTIMREHTVWFSHYGPIIAMPNLPWNEHVAFTARDANMENYHALQQWWDMGRASDMEAFKKAHKTWNAMPFVNTIAAGKEGKAVFIDGSTVGNLSDEAIAMWRMAVEKDPAARGLYQAQGLILLDGSNSRFEWQDHAESVTPGVVPYVKKPKLERTDYVLNANDSHWFAHATDYLEGYSPVFGPEGTSRSLRTRMNAKLLTDGIHAGEDGKFSMKELQDALFSNRSLAAELLSTPLVEACKKTTTVTVGDKAVELSEACGVIANYNGRLDLDSKGAVLFREWVNRYKYHDGQNAGPLFAVPFDVSDPLNTPNTLSDADLALTNLGHAVSVLNTAGLSLDATLAETQFSFKDDKKISVHGGSGNEGVANLIASGTINVPSLKINAKKIEGSSRLTDMGYPVVHGSSFVLNVSYTDDGPEAEALLTYSQSGDPSSEHFDDQTKLFSKKKWRPALFKAEDIEKDIKSSLRLTAKRQ